MPSSFSLLLSKRHLLSTDIPDTSSTLSSSESNEYHEHNIWNPMLEPLFHTHVGISMEALILRGRYGANRTFFSFLHWTSCATKNEPAYEKKTLPSTTSRTSQTGLEMTKRASGDSIKLDNYDSQSLELCPTIGDWTILDKDRPFSTRRLRT